jgi:anti-anti-sigma factor
LTASSPKWAPAGSFDSTVVWHGRIAEVTMQGALDRYSATDARNLLLDVLEREPSRVVVDVGDAFVDSIGIGVLVQVAQRARQERRDVRLRCHQSLAEILRRNVLDELLGVAGVTKAFDRASGPQKLAA